jgi:hypothetical protein
MVSIIIIFFLVFTFAGRALKRGVKVDTMMMRFIRIFSFFFFFFFFCLWL